MNRLPTVGPVPLVVAAVAAFASGVSLIGADARWLPALGREIVAAGAIPDGVPFASAPSAGWENVPVLAELVFYGLYSAIGEHGFVLLQASAVALGTAMLALDARREGAGAEATALTLLAVAVAGIASVIVVRLQLFSLALFPLALALVRAEARRPTRRIWLLVPLVALWTNLHGAVLVGLAVAGAYLVFERARQDAATAAGVAVASVVALAATPALAGTVDYYLGALRNEAAAQRVGLWAPLNPTAPLDLLLLAGIVLLGGLALRARPRPRLWELVALAGVAVLTVRSGRTGIWLLFLLAAPAARGLRLRPREALRLGAPIGALLLTVAVFGIVRGPLPSGASEELLDEALRRAAGTPILADAVPGEQVVLAGGRVWVSNPLDAFPRETQRLYLDWVEGRPPGDAALARAPRVVLVRRGGPAEDRLEALRDLRRVRADDGVALYLKPR